MKFFAIFAFVAFFAVASAATYGYDYDYEPEYAATEYSEAEPAELDRSPRGAHPPAKACKSVLVSCAPIVQKVPCKGGKY